MNFRPMRRSDRKMQQPEIFLKEHNWGVLSVLGDSGYPYGVPVNFGYAEGKLYIHSTSSESHKLDAIRENPKVCLTVVGKHQLLEEEFTTQFSSVIVFGTARLITGDVEKRLAAVRMMQSLTPAVEKEAIASCGALKTMTMIEITPEHITGKERKEAVK